MQPVSRRQVSLSELRAADPRANTALFLADVGSVAAATVTVAVAFH